MAVAAPGILGASLLALALFTRRPALVPWALAALGAEYGGALFIHPHGPLGAVAPLYGTALLLLAELAYWSLGPTATAPAERAMIARKLTGIAVLATAALALDGVLMAAASASIRGGLALFAVGFAASALALAVLVGLSRRARG
jgi:hypothetical protein